MSTSTAKKNRATLTQREIDSLVKAFSRIEARGRAVDYERAKWADRVAGLCGLYSRRVMTEQLGLSPSTAGAYLRRLEDLGVIPDREVWIAVGWPRVRQIARLDQASRAAAVSRVLDARDSAGVVSDTRVREILSPFVDTAAPSKKEESESPNGVSRALEELKYLVETYELPGYTLPPKVAEVLKNL